MKRTEILEQLELLLAPYRIEITNKLVENWHIALERVTLVEFKAATRKLLQEVGRVYAPTPGEALAYIKTLRREALLKAPQSPLPETRPSKSQIEQVKAKHPELFN